MKNAAWDMGFEQKQLALSMHGERFEESITPQFVDFWRDSSILAAYLMPYVLLRQELTKAEFSVLIENWVEWPL